MSKDGIIVIDNMRSHHAKIVREVLDAFGIRYLYLPPYRPGFNPIDLLRN
ncbi:transposase [Dubosiella newyorkensis]